MKYLYREKCKEFQIQWQYLPLCVYFLSTEQCFKLCSKGKTSTDCTDDKLIISTLLFLLLDCFGQRLLILLFLFDSRNNVSLFHGVKPTIAKVKRQFFE